MLSANSNIVFLFSGQGSHYRGMGKELYQSNSVFRNSIQRSDRLIYQNIGISLIDELYESGDEVFDSILITHPAIVAIELAMLAVMKSKEIIPAAVAGVSLGEFSAAVAAGYWSGEEALATCIEQAKLIASHVHDGGMTVVIGNKTQKLLDFMDGKELYDNSINFKGCFTVSGRKTELDKLDNFLGEQGMVYQRLEVEYPFHSPFLDVAGTFWQHERFDRNPDSSDIKMYSTYLEGLVDNEIPENFFWNVVSNPFRFPEIVKKMEQDLGSSFYLDLGPSGTMATFMKYNLGAGNDTISESKPITFLSQHHDADHRLEQFTRDFIDKRIIEIK